MSCAPYEVDDLARAEGLKRLRVVAAEEVLAVGLLRRHVVRAHAEVEHAVQDRDAVGRLLQLRLAHEVEVGVEHLDDPLALVRALVDGDGRVDVPLPEADVARVADDRHLLQELARPIALVERFHLREVEGVVARAEALHVTSGGVQRALIDFDRRRNFCAEAAERGCAERT